MFDFLNNSFIAAVFANMAVSCRSSGPASVVKNDAERNGDGWIRIDNPVLQRRHHLAEVRITTAQRRTTATIRRKPLYTSRVRLPALTCDISQPMAAIRSRVWNQYRLLGSGFRDNPIKWQRRDTRKRAEEMAKRPQQRLPIMKVAQLTAREKEPYPMNKTMFPQIVGKSVKFIDE